MNTDECYINLSTIRNKFLTSLNHYLNKADLGKLNGRDLYFADYESHFKIVSTIEPRKKTLTFRTFQVIPSEIVDGRQDLKRIPSIEAVAQYERINDNTYPTVRFINQSGIKTGYASTNAGVNDFCQKYRELFEKHLSDPKFHEPKTGVSRKEIGHNVQISEFDAGGFRSSDN